MMDPEPLLTTDPDLRDLTSALATLADGGPPIWERWVPQLREALGGEQVLLFWLEENHERLGVEAAWSAGASVGDAAFARGIREMVATADRRWGIFDPRRPELPQRNRVLAFPPTAVFRAELEERHMLAERYGVADEESASLATQGFAHSTRVFTRLEIERRWQLRALVCGDVSLLAWMGAFVDGAPDPRLQSRLQALIPAVARRLILEQRLLGEPMARLALEIALEQLPRAAFVVDRAGRMKHGNRLACDQIAGERTVTEAALADAVTRGSAQYKVIPLHVSGAAPHFLVLGAVPAGDNARMERAARKWNLTPAEHRVLSRLITGEANKEIAHKLGSSPKTIEVHVTRLLAKSNTASRSELCAAFWSRI